MIVKDGMDVCWGIPDGDVVGAEGFPIGKVRIIFRNDEFAHAYVLSPTGIRKFYVRYIVSTGMVSPVVEIGRTKRVRALELNVPQSVVVYGK